MGGDSDFAQNFLHVLQDLLIAKPKDAKASPLKDFRSILIGFMLLAVNVAVGFDDEGLRRSEKVYDEAIDALWAPEVKAFQAVSAQTVPQSSFRFCHVPPELNCKLPLRVCDPLPADLR